jgi:hypothetical protein
MVRIPPPPRALTRDREGRWRWADAVNAERWQVDDVTTAGEAVWSGVHGHSTVELTGFFAAVGRDPVRSYSEILTRMSIGLGDDARATARSLSTARRRAVRADRATAASAR